MALRWCILLGLLAFACAQEVLNFINATDLEESIAERYGSDDAVARRRQHLYCLGYFDEVEERPATGPGFADYPDDTDVWSIYMQYPVLSYLDVNRKGALYRVILELAGIDSPNATVENDLCQGALDFYAVTEYAESVLVRMYFRNPIGSTITELNNRFRTNVLVNQPEVYTMSFRGRIALNVLADSIFNDSYVAGLPPGSNLHPGSTLPNDRDPTFLAVVLGSWAQNVTIYEAEEDLNIQARASNPNPINYGLEAGDIVFSVIGSVLLAGVLGLVILGFCVHPFFLA